MNPKCLMGKADQRSDHGVAIAGEETWTAGIGEAVVARTHRRGLRVVAGLRARSENKLLPSVEFHLNASPGFFVLQGPLA